MLFFMLELLEKMSRNMVNSFVLAPPCLTIGTLIEEKLALKLLDKEKNIHPKEIKVHM
jgi:hypothetical protein